MVLAVGGGTRVRHTLSIGLDLGLPVGGIAQLIGAMEELNAILLNALLAKHGSMPMQRDHFWDLPLYFASGILPIAISIPPYHFWEPPPDEGVLPQHGSDFGLFQLAEVLSMGQLIFVKDQDGLYDRDPALHPDAKLIPRITLAELLANPPPTNILDEELFRAWASAKNLTRIQIVNGRKPGMLAAAVRGEDVGTVIVKEAPRG
jgi:molybdenum storage protein